MSDPTSETPWLEPVEHDTSRGRAFISDLGWRLRTNLVMHLSMLATLATIFYIPALPYALAITVVLVFFGVLSALCLWAARERYDLPQWFRGILRAFGLVLMTVIAIIVYGLVFGYTLEQTSGDELYPQPTIEMIEPVGHENMT